MLKLLACLLSISLAAEAPFWKVKPKVYDRVENGEVIVSVTSHELPPTQTPRHRLHLAGGGQVAAPCAFVFQSAQKYEELAGLSGYVTKAHYEAPTQILELTVSAFFHSSTMRILVKAGAEPVPGHIDFRLVTGPMQGFAWQMEFSSLNAQKCEIGIDGEFKYDEFPIPRIFLEFGLEMVFQGMAKRLRRHVEELYKIR